jgi:iron complex transport system substrate-binding protein
LKTVQLFASTSLSRTINLGKFFVVCALIFVSPLLAQDPQPAPNVPNVAPARLIMDETGRTVRVPIAVDRIVSLAPSITETLYALGLQGHLVGDTDFCDYPAEARSKPRVGGAIDPNLERIAALHPDLVLLTRSINRLDTVRALDVLNIPSYTLAEPQTVEDITASIRKLADVLGAADAAQSVTDDMQQHLAALQARLKPVTPTRVLFVVWSDPLISIGKDTFIADALRRGGAVSIVDSSQNWPQTNLEEIVRLQPEAIIYANNDVAAATREFEALTVRPGWRLLEAIQNHRLIILSDAINRPAPRIVSVIEELAHQLHPDAFSNPPDKNEPVAPATQPTSTDSKPNRTALQNPNPREVQSACAR